jgi:hemerythrin superfamily protein
MAAKKAGSGKQGGSRRAANQDNERAGSDDEGNDAIDMLLDDHRRVEEMFEEFESSKDDDDDDEKAQRVGAICLELTIHATLEEEIFYPAARAALGEEGADVLDEAEVEHESVRMLIAQLAEEMPEDDLYDAKVKVLSEYVKHHVVEEEGELFPKLRESDFDSAALAEEMRERKEQLQEELQEESTA